MHSPNEQKLWWTIFTLTGDLESYLHYKLLSNELEGNDTVGQLQDESDYTETE